MFTHDIIKWFYSSWIKNVFNKICVNYIGHTKGTLFWKNLNLHFFIDILSNK